MGHAIVINNVATQYPGSRKDTDALVEAYKTMNFEVHLYENCDDSVRPSKIKNVCFKSFFFFRKGTSKRYNKTQIWRKKDFSSDLCFV